MRLRNMAAKNFDLFHKQWFLLVATFNVGSFAGNIKPFQCCQLKKAGNTGENENVSGNDGDLHGCSFVNN